MMVNALRYCVQQWFAKVVHRNSNDDARSDLINTAALARCSGTAIDANRFNGFVSGEKKTVKRVKRRRRIPNHRAKATVLRAPRD